MNNEQNNKNGTWEIILRIIIAVASALAGALGMSACVG
ncbi:MAG: smalltalk protein [Bacteroidaceae bacterium]|nr:smalltalk protein [Bacteroidaceae bacterium]